VLIKSFGEYLKFFENYYQETSWTKNIDGKSITITIKDVENLLSKMSAPVENIKVSDIVDKCVHAGKTDKETLDRSEESDLKYPIIICRDINGGLGMIIDGHHRLFKCMNNNIYKIKARILDLKNCPESYKVMFS